MNIKPFQKEYEALFNYAAIGIVTTNHEGKIVLANKFALQQFGYELEDLVGKTIETLIPRRFHHKHEHHRTGYTNTNPHSRPMGIGMDLFGVKKDGIEFPVEVSLSSYTTSDGMYVVAFINDISIRKESEKQLVNLNSELERKVEERTQSLTEALEKEKELNELKSRFVSMASHEFRTPLSTILSSTYLLAKYQKAEEQPKRDRHIQRIISAVNTLNDILNDFLSVGKIEEGRIQLRFSEINVASLISETVNELKTIIKPGQTINYEHRGETQFILDPTLLKHITMNLISNAVKFSPENEAITAYSEMQNKQLIFSVKDNGIGISHEDQQHLFERFFRGGNVTNIQGTGLGLHIVARYAELMNGTIKWNSELNKGTEFIITFAPQAEKKTNHPES